MFYVHSSWTAPCMTCTCRSVGTASYCCQIWPPFPDRLYRLALLARCLASGGNESLLIYRNFLCGLQVLLFTASANAFSHLEIFVFLCLQTYSPPLRVSLQTVSLLVLFVRALPSAVPWRIPASFTLVFRFGGPWDDLPRQHWPPPPLQNALGLVLLWPPDLLPSTHILSVFMPPDQLLLLLHSRHLQRTLLLWQLKKLW